MSITLIDSEPFNYLLLTLIFTTIYQYSFFIVAFICKFDKVTDFAGILYKKFIIQKIYKNR